MPIIQNSFLKNESNENYNERDLLYKILFDVKNDVNELKKLINSILSKNSRIEVSEDQKKLLTTHSLNINSDELRVQDKNLKEKENAYQIATEVYNENESLSIEKKEKELIIKALSKNKNKRKSAAKDLGISERTLYRKIKHYKLEKS